MAMLLNNVIVSFVSYIVLYSEVSKSSILNGHQLHYKNDFNSRIKEEKNGG